MGFLARKIEKSKWKNETAELAEICADAITSCLRTSCNTLSVWYIQDSSDVDEAILAIVSSPKFSKLDALDIVLMKPEWFESNQFEIKEQEGNSCITDLNKKHRDIASLNYSKLGTIAEQILKEVQSNNSVRKTASDITKIIWKAIEEERLTISQLNPRLQKKVVHRCKKLNYAIDKYIDSKAEYTCEYCHSITSLFAEQNN